MEWFMTRIEKGGFDVTNPYNGRISLVTAMPEDVHSIVFWSKNFGPFIHGGYGDLLQQKGYRLFFNFTINSENPLLEPHVPPLSERLQQLAYLSDRMGGGCIHWRFDPVCFYRWGGGAIEDNLDDFGRIAEFAGGCDIRTCITSFMDHYPKIKKRLRPLDGFSFVEPLDSVKIAKLREMEAVLTPFGIRLFTCCEQPLLEQLPADSGIGKSACIPGELLLRMFGGNLLLKKDSGQRVRQGCGCQASSDIGSYTDHPCYHNCLFCYANPRCPQAISKPVINQVRCETRYEQGQGNRHQV